MPVWLLRLVWTVRGKRRVRLHPVDENKPSIEGIRIGKWKGAHHLVGAQLLLAPETTVSLEGVVEVMDDRVLFVQVLS